MSSELLGRYILWDGEPAWIVSDTSGKRFVGVQKVKPDNCPHCGGQLPGRTIDVVYGSIYWTTMAKPVPTLTPHQPTKQV